MTPRRLAPIHDLRAFAAALFADPRARPRSTAALMLLGGLLEGVGLLLLVPLAGLLVAPGGDGAAAGGHVQALARHWFVVAGARSDLARLGLLLALFVPVVLLRAVVLTLRDRRLAALQLDFTERQRIGLVRALAAARWQDVTGLRHARVTAALGSDIGRLAAAAHYLLQGLVALVMLGAQWLLTLVIAPAFAAIALALAAAGAVMLRRSLGEAGRLGEALVAGQLRMMHGAGQFLAGLKQAAAGDAQDAFVAEIEADARALTEYQLAFERRQSRARAVIGGGSALLGAAVLAIGVRLAVPVANLIAAIVVLARMAGPAAQLRQSAQQLATLLPAHAAILALRRDLARAPAGSAHRPADGGATGRANGGPIVFDRVGYAHGADAGGVRDVGVTLHPGEIVAVTGASGAGKTTFADLLAGLIEPDRGTITIAGTRLDRDSAPALRRRIAYVTQDGFLTNDTIRRNLAPGGAEEGDDAELWTALERAGAAGLVRAMPHGLDTVVAERGARLSGGERQRIALARALLRDPALLILDEATGAIDVAGEAAILARLAADPARPTIVLVAHRAETLAFATRRLTFDAGRLIADE